MLPGHKFHGKIDANLLWYILGVFFVVCVLLSIRIGLLAAWEAFERFLEEQLHFKRSTVTIINISVWLVSVIVILFIYLRHRTKRRG